MCSSKVSDPANRLRKTRKKKSSAVPLFRSGRRSLVCARLRNKGKRELRGWYSFNPRTAREQGLVAYGQTLVSTLLPLLRGAAPFLPSADGKSQSIRKKRIPHKRICAFLRRYTAYPCTEPSPKLTASASSTCRMAFSSSEPIFSRRRRLSSVRICSVRMMESLVSP